MRIAHFGKFGPHYSGQYATIKDLIWAEKLAGMDADFFDCISPENAGKKDDWLVCQDWNKIDEYDIIIQHYGMPREIADKKLPYLIAIHGRPENCFRMEQLGKSQILTFLQNVPKRDRCFKGFITFWKEHIPFWKSMLPENYIHYISPPVNTFHFKPEGEKYKFKKPGYPNIIIADIWREDTTPFNVIFASNYYRIKYNPKARIHIYGAPIETYMNYLLPLQNTGIIGDLYSFVSFLDKVYRAGDILVTPNIIATRTIREAFASGMSVVAPHGCRYTKFQADPRNVFRFAKQIHYCWRWMQATPDCKLRLHEKAKKYFDFNSTGRAMKEVIEGVLR